ncbi:MAG: radical SAM protein [Deltaproteobacteria bacterium]|nr:radical SAM protein [Deltaproteobacteria bacterium]
MRCSPRCASCSGDYNAPVKASLQDELRRIQDGPGATAFLRSNVILDTARRRWPVIADVTVGCALRCRFCHRVRRDPARLASAELFERIATEVLPRASEVAFGARHEPLLHPDLPERIRGLADARDRLRTDTAICVLTSGVLLEPDLATRFATCGVDHVLFSIDSTDEATYSRLRPPATWAGLKPRLAAFMAARRDDRPTVAVQALVLRSTVPHLRSTLEELAAMGVRRFNTTVVEWETRQVADEVVSMRGPDAPWLAREFEALSATAQALGVAFRPPRTAPPAVPGEVWPILAEGTIWDEAATRRERPTVCAASWGKVRIDDRGFVFPCFRILDPRHAWGNLLERSFAEIVNGEVAVRARTMLLEGRAPNPVCAGCCWGPAPRPAG